MEDRFKFRAKSLRTGEWVYGSLVYAEDTLVKKYDDKEVRENTCKIFEPSELIHTVGTQQVRNGNPNVLKRDLIIHDVDPKTVGQCLGGMFFEGDIIRHIHAYNSLHEIVYANGCIGVRRYGCVDNSVIPIVNPSSQYKIIGNIHENPELLEKE